MSLLIERHVFDGPEVTVVAPAPSPNSLILGFEDGTTALFDIRTKTKLTVQNVSTVHDAVNGIAMTGGHVAVSTRSDISFVRLKTTNSPSLPCVPGGAHMVLSTLSGSFVAPCGVSGVLLAHPDSRSMNLMTQSPNPLYFYRATALESSGKEMLVFANRTAGVGLSSLENPSSFSGVHILSFPGLDVVDVCEASAGSLSVVAISPDAELLWIEDASKADDPVALSLSGIEGKVYRVLAHDGHLFVLSSLSLTIWPNFVTERILGPSTTNIPPMFFRGEAIDMAICDGLLCIVMADNAIQWLTIADIKNLEQQRENHAPPASNRLNKPMDVAQLAPTWSHHDKAMICAN